MANNQAPQHHAPQEQYVPPPPDYESYEGYAYEVPDTPAVDEHQG
jgi:hypothetical protein